MSVAHRLEKRETEDTCAFRPTQRVEEPADRRFIQRFHYSSSCP